MILLVSEVVEKRPDDSAGVVLSVELSQQEDLGTGGARHGDLVDVTVVLHEYVLTQLLQVVFSPAELVHSL
jgi:hypothetical protein